MDNRNEELRFAIRKLEDWLERWRSGQAPNVLQLRMLKNAVAELHLDEGEAHDDSEPSSHQDIANMLVRADPDIPLETDRPIPATDYSLSEFERDMDLLRPKFDYLSWRGGQPIGRA